MLLPGDKVLVDGIEYDWIPRYRVGFVDCKANDIGLYSVTLIEPEEFLGIDIYIDEEFLTLYSEISDLERIIYGF